MNDELSYAQRHDHGIDVINTLKGGAIDAVKGADDTVERWGAMGSYAVDYVLGEIWSRPQLSRRDRSLVVIAILATFGRDFELRYHVEAALNHGLSREEIEEILLTVAGYAGFPFGIGGMQIASRVFARLDGVEHLPPRTGAKHKDDAERRLDALDVRRTLTGGVAADTVEEEMRNLEARLGPVGKLAFEWAFGELWAREQLSRRDRSLVVVTILTTLSRERELRVHVQGALNHGVTREEIEEVMVQMAAYGGLPRAVEGILTARETFARVDEHEAETTP